MSKPIFIWQKKKLKKIEPEDIVCLFTEGNYTKVYVRNKIKYIVRSTLSGALNKLPQDIFIKIHRSLAISIYHVDHIHRDHLLIGDESLPIGKQYYKSLIRKLNIIE